MGPATVQDGVRDDVHGCYSGAGVDVGARVAELGVGASPAEPLQLVMGAASASHDHVRRLQAAGLVTRVPMRRGQGSLIVLTRVRQRRPGWRSTGSSKGNVAGGEPTRTIVAFGWFHGHGRGYAGAKVSRAWPPVQETTTERP